MTLCHLTAFALSALFLPAGTAQALGEGQTQPRLSHATITLVNTRVDLIPPTSGAGNLLGLHCVFASDAYYRTQGVDVIVDGGPPRTLVLYGSDFPRESSGAGRAWTGFLPMNVRFESSLEVELWRGGSPAVNYSVTCVASWALD